MKKGRARRGEESEEGRVKRGERGGESEEGENEEGRVKKGRVRRGEEGRLVWCTSFIALTYLLKNNKL